MQMNPQAASEIADNKNHKTRSRPVQIICINSSICDQETHLAGGASCKRIKNTSTTDLPVTASCEPTEKTSTTDLPVQDSLKFAPRFTVQRGLDASKVMITFYIFQQLFLLMFTEILSNPSASQPDIPKLLRLSLNCFH